MNVTDLENITSEAVRITEHMQNHTRKVIENFAPHRLRGMELSYGTLRAMKRELRSFNTATGRWKD